MATGSMPRTGPLGPCFACGEMGHLRLHCPKVAAATDGSRKSYLFCTGAVGAGSSSHAEVLCDPTHCVGRPDLHPKLPDKIGTVGDVCVATCH